MSQREFLQNAIPNLAETISFPVIEKLFVGMDGLPIIYLRGRSAAIDIGNTEVNCIFGSLNSLSQM